MAQALAQSFTACQPPAAPAARRRAPAVVCSAARPEQHVDRRALLLGAGAVVAGAAVQQGLPAAAADCELTTAPSGLQFCDVVEGSGDAPTAGARIRAHYTGRLQSNGAVFDSSYERRKPLVFQIGVGQVIKGWDQGILGGDGVPPMKPGGKRKLVIPAELGYGARGAGGVIPGGATLVFDVEYLGLQGAR